MATQPSHTLPTGADTRPADDWLESSRIGTILDELFPMPLPTSENPAPR